jgi:hypothetical protein
MADFTPDKQGFRQLVRSKVTEAVRACLGERLDMILRKPTVNLIVAGQLIKLGSAFAIRLGADEDGIARPTIQNP